MTTTTSVDRLDAYTQFQQFGSSLGSIFSSLCESTDSAFRRVHVMKRDEQGNIKLYDKKDPETNEYKKVALLTYIEDIKSGELYLDEPGYIVAVKCAMIVVGMPLYTVGKMAHHAIKTPLEIGAIALETIFKIGQQLCQSNLSEAASEFKRGCTQIAGVFGNGLYEIVKAPIFMLGCELAAIYGIFKPYHGRKIEALIEKAWQNGASYKEDFRNVPARSGETCWEAFRKDMAGSHPFYLAHCFQVRGQVNAPRVVVIKREAL